MPYYFGLWKKQKFTKWYSSSKKNFDPFRWLLSYFYEYSSCVILYISNKTKKNFVWGSIQCILYMSISLALTKTNTFQCIFKCKRIIVFVKANDLISLQFRINLTIAFFILVKFVNGVQPFFMHFLSIFYFASWLKGIWRAKTNVKN